MSKKAKARAIFFMIASLSIALVLSIIIGTCFFVSLFKNEKVEQRNRYRLSIGLVDTKKASTNVYKANIVRGGVLCTDFTRIADRCGYTMIVNGNEMKFYLNNEQSDILTLYLGEDTAYINSNPVHLSVAVYKVSERIHLPIEFISNYFDGVTIDVNEEKGTISIEYINPTECSLRLKYPEGLEPLDKSDFPDQTN